MQRCINTTSLVLRSPQRRQVYAVCASLTACGRLEGRAASGIAPVSILRDGAARLLRMRSVGFACHAPRCLVAGAAMAAILLGASARANERLLEETVEFTGTVLFLQSRVPALVVGAVRDGKSVVFGFGESPMGQATDPTETHYFASGQ